MDSKDNKSDDKPTGDFVKVKNRYRSKRDQKKDRGQGAARSSKFTGLNKDELEGIVICESNPTPTAQQFDALLDALVVYAGSRNAKVKTSLRSSKYLELADMKPKPPDPSEYTKPDKTVDTALQAASLDVWKAGCAIAQKQHSKYKQDIEGLFETVIGQLGREIRNNLKGMTGWKSVDGDNDPVETQKRLILRETFPILAIRARGEHLL